MFPHEGRRHIFPNRIQTCIHMYANPELNHYARGTDNLFNLLTVRSSSIKARTFSSSASVPSA